MDALDPGSGFTSSDGDYDTPNVISMQRDGTFQASSWTCYPTSILQVNPAMHMASFSAASLGFLLNPPTAMNKRLFRSQFHT
jgi:hypothetical protein